MATCIFGVFQYGMVLTYGITVKDLNSYYGLTEKGGDTLYSCLNFGACALSFIPGLCYDRWGCAATLLLAILIFDAAVVLQLVWTPAWPAWLSTMQGLMFCYTSYGFASTTFNVIGSFAPLLAFPAKDIGKVSACVQVCLSLGITVQSQAYYAIKSLGGDFVINYLKYALVFTNVSGILMCLAFWSARDLMYPPNDVVPATEALAPSPTEEGDNSTLSGGSLGPPPTQTLRRILTGVDFWFMNLLFFVAVGFSFSFLDVEARIADVAGVETKPLAGVFGILNALGRLSVTIPLDYTRNHEWGGVFTYISSGLLIFMFGVMILAFPYSSSAAEQSAVVVANAVVAYGYGCLLGIMPPALKLRFGSGHLGLIYGILYVGVAISEPLWSMIFLKSSGCSGLACYRTYYVCCISGFAVVLVLSVSMMMRDRRRPKGARDLSRGLCDAANA